jgi:hypothetical protein
VSVYVLHNYISCVAVVSVVLLVSDQIMDYNVSDPDPVRFGPFWSDPDPDVRILALINYRMSTTLVFVKALNSLGISVA